MVSDHAGDANSWVSRGQSVRLVCSLSADGAVNTGSIQLFQTGTSQGKIVLSRHGEAFPSSGHPIDMECRKLNISLLAYPSASARSAPLLTATTIGKISPFCHHAPKHLWRTCSRFEQRPLVYSVFLPQQLS